MALGACTFICLAFIHLLSKAADNGSEQMLGEDVAQWRTGSLALLVCLFLAISSLKP